MNNDIIIICGDSSENTVKPNKILVRELNGTYPVKLIFDLLTEEDDN